MEERNKQDFEAMSLEDLSKLLTKKQKDFVAELDRDGNGTKAALRAGFGKGTNENSAAVAASRMLKDPKIAAYRRARAREMLSAAGIGEEGVKLRLVEIYNRCMQAEEVLIWDSSRKEWVPSGEWKFDSKGALKALELMGDSLGMFQKQLSLDTTGSLEEFLEKLGEQEM